MPDHKTRYGDGFKTAAVALLGQPEKCREVHWLFSNAAGRTIRWDFVGAVRPAVGTFRAAKVLEVHVTDVSADADAVCGGDVMRQVHVLIFVRHVVGMW